MEIPDNVKEKILFVARYVRTVTDDWLRIKREIINALRKEDRGLFSTRHPKTKKQILNEFDISVMKYWKEITGIEVRIDPKKIHDPNYDYRPHGWTIRLINEERKRQAKKRRESP